MTNPTPWSGRKSVFAGLFVEGGAALVTLVSNKIECWDLASPGAPRWEARLSQALSIAELPTDRLLAVSNTRGQVLCLDLLRGKTRWEADSGTRDPHLLALVDGRLLITGLGGAIRVFAGKTGKLRASWDTCVALGGMQLAGGLVHVVAGMGEVIPCQFDPDAGRLWAQPTVQGDLAALSPDGARRIVLDRPGGALSLVTPKATLAAGPVTLGAEHFAYPPIWSPDGAMIALCRRDAVVILSSIDLSTVATIPAQDPLPPAFSPDGRCLCVCATGASRLISLAEVMATG